MSPLIQAVVDERRPNVGRQTVVLTWPLSLNTTKRPREIAIDQAVQLDDFMSTERGLEVREGFGAVGSAVLDNIPLRLAQYEREDLQRVMMAHTKTKLYYLNGTTWTDRTRASGAYTGSDSNPWDSVVCLNDYVLSNYIDKINFWDGTAANALDIPRTLAIQTVAPTGALGGTGITGAFLYWTTEYDSVSGVESANNAVTLLMNPVNQTVTITKPATINAFATHWRLYRTVAAGAYPVGYRVATTAIATPTFADATSDTTLITLPLYSSTSVPHILENVRAKYMLAFGGRLVLLNLKEESPTVVRALRVRWSKEGGLRSSADWSALGSGFADLAETPDEIVGASKLANFAVIYKKRSLIHMYETQDINAPFGFEWREIADLDKGVGLVSQATLANLTGFHIGLWNDNVYMYAGTRPTPIGDPIVRSVIQQAGVANLSRAFAAVVPSKQWYILFVPLTGQTWPEQGYVYDWRRDLWVGMIKKQASCASVFIASSATDWDNAPNVTWDEMVGAWNDSGDTGTAQLSVGNPSTKAVQFADSTMAYDGTNAIWTTGDLDFGFSDVTSTVIRVRLRVDSFGIAARLQCLVSPDSGNSFPVGAAKSANTVTGEQDVFFDLRHTAKRHTIRFMSDSNVRIVEWAPSFQVRGRIRQ